MVNTNENDPPAGAAGKDEQEAAPKKRTGRPSAKKATEHVASGTVDAIGPDHTSAEAPRDRETAEPASPAKTTRRRSAKTEPAADVGVAGEAGAPAQTGSDASEAAVTAGESAEPKAPRKAAARKSATKSTGAEDAKAEQKPAKRPATGKKSAKSAAHENDSVGQPARATTSLLFQAPDLPTMAPPRASRGDEAGESGTTSVRRRNRRRSGDEPRDSGSDQNSTVKTRQRKQPEPITEPQKVKGSTRLEAKKQRRRDGRDAGRRRTVITEAEFLARRESVDRVMVVRSKGGRIQIGVLEDGVLVEHYVARNQDASLIGNVYLGRVQNVLPSMEAAFVDIGRGRNAVLYSGEVDWDAASAAEGEGKNQPRRIELALKPGDRVLVQVTKDPVGHKGARLTSQISLPGRYLVYVPNGSMNGISRKLPDTERARLKKILKEVLPENVGVIVRTAAEGATDEQLTRDVNRLTEQWSQISKQVEAVQAPALLHSEPDLLVKIVRDVFNEDFQKLVIAGDDAKSTIEGYLKAVAPDLLDRVEIYAEERDAFDEYRITEQIEKALDRKVWLPSGGSLVIDRTEAMTVIDVNTGKFVGSGGNLEETVTKNNLEAAEEIVRQLRLRDIGGIIVVDFIDMVLESNRDLVLRRLVECLSRDRTKHQVAEVTSLGLVQMTRKKLGLGLLESFSEPCEVCGGRGLIVHHDPVVKHRGSSGDAARGGRRGKSAQGAANAKNGNSHINGTHAITEDVRNALAQIAKSTVSSVPETAKAAEAEAEPAGGTEDLADDSATASEAPIAILDIPVAPAVKTRAKPRISPADAESILDSVLDALPEPNQPGQGGRRVSRRASSAGGSAQAIAPGSE